jgi:hypothetical protein
MDTFVLKQQHHCNHHGLYSYYMYYYCYYWSIHCERRSERTVFIIVALLCYFVSGSWIRWINQLWGEVGCAWLAGSSIGGHIYSSSSVGALINLTLCIILRCFGTKRKLFLEAVRRLLCFRINSFFSFTRWQTHCIIATNNNGVLRRPQPVLTQAIHNDPDAYGWQWWYILLCKTTVGRESLLGKKERLNCSLFSFQTK